MSVRRMMMMRHGPAPAPALVKADHGRRDAAKRRGRRLRRRVVDFF
jgi:hypothetical protein